MKNEWKKKKYTRKFHENEGVFVSLSVSSLRKNAPPLFSFLFFSFLGSIIAAEVLQYKGRKAEKNRTISQFHILKTP